MIQPVREPAELSTVVRRKKKHFSDVCSLICRMKRAAHQSGRVWIKSTFSFCVWNLWHTNMQNYFTYQHKIVVISSGSAHSEVPQVHLNCAITVTSLSGQLSVVNWMSESSTLMSEGGTTTVFFPQIWSYVPLLLIFYDSINRFQF